MCYFKRYYWVWKHFWWSQPGRGCKWPEVLQTSYKAQDNIQPQIIVWPKSSVKIQWKALIIIVLYQYQLHGFGKVPWLWSMILPSGKAVQKTYKKSLCYFCNFLWVLSHFQIKSHNNNNNNNKIKLNLEEKIPTIEKCIKSCPVLCWRNTFSCQNWRRDVGKTVGLQVSQACPWPQLSPGYPCAFRQVPQLWVWEFSRLQNGGSPSCLIRLLWV